MLSVFQNVKSSGNICIYLYYLGLSWSDNGCPIFHHHSRKTGCCQDVCRPVSGGCYGHHIHGEIVGKQGEIGQRALCTDLNDECEFIRDCIYLVDWRS